MKLREIVIEGWSRQSDNRFSAGGADIRDHVFHTRHRVRCPKCREQLHPKAFKQHTDKEGRTTHWTYTHDCGAELTVSEG